MFEPDTKTRLKSGSRQGSKPTTQPQLDRQISNKNYMFDDQHFDRTQNKSSHQQYRNQSNENILVTGDRITKPGQIYKDQFIMPNSLNPNTLTGPSNELPSNQPAGKPPLLVPIGKLNYQAQTKTKLSALPEGLQDLGGPLITSARRTHTIKSEHGSRNKIDTSLHSSDRKEVRNLGSAKRSATPLSRDPQYYNEDAALTLEEKFQLIAYGWVQHVPETRSRTPVLLSESRERVIKAKVPNFSRKLPPALTNRAVSQPDHVFETNQPADIELLKVTGLEPVLKSQISGKNIIIKQVKSPKEERKREKSFEKYKPQQYLDKGTENQQNVTNMLKESPRHQEALKTVPKVTSKKNSVENRMMKSPRNEEKQLLIPKLNPVKQKSSKLPPTHNTREGSKRVSSATQKTQKTGQENTVLMSAEERLENGTESVRNRDLASEILMNHVDTGGFDAWEIDSPLKMKSGKL